MLELDEIIDAGHDLKQVQTLILACKEKTEKSGSGELKYMLKRIEDRIEINKARLDAISCHKNICMVDGCPDRQKFNPKDPHASAPGAFM